MDCSLCDTWIYADWSVEWDGLEWDGLQIHESMLTVECRMRPAMRWTAICCLCLNWAVYKVPSICSTSACPAAAVRMRVKLMVPRWRGTTSADSKRSMSLWVAVLPLLFVCLSVCLSVCLRSVYESVCTSTRCPVCLLVKFLITTK